MLWKKIFIYFGVTFTHNGSFVKHKNCSQEQGRKAMFSVLKKIKKLNLPFDIHLQMFDCMVAPILMYGSEVYGYERQILVRTGPLPS